VLLSKEADRSFVAFNHCLKQHPDYKKKTD